MASPRIPQTVRFALIWLGVFASVQLLAGLARAEFPLVLTAMLTALLLWALAVRKRWAYVATFLVIAAIVVVLLAQGEPILAGVGFVAGGLVWAPLVIAKGWYFPVRRRYQHA